MQLLHRVGQFYIALRAARHRRSPVQWRGRFVLPVGRVLICLPQAYESLLEAWQIISNLSLDRSKLILVAKKPYLQAVGPPAGEKRIPYEAKDVNAFGLARKRLVRAVRKSNPAVAVDLSTSSVPLGAHLALSSGAPLRVCLAESPHVAAFNVVVRGSASSSYEHKITSLFHYLGLLQRSGAEISK